MSAGEFTIDEWVCVALARTIADGEIVFHGFGSPCAQVAMHIAKRTHAPNMVLVEGSTYALDPEPAFIPATSNDWALLRGARHVLRFEELFDLGARGGLDRMFLSGGQIDPYGNTNVTAIGGLPRPKVKLGGGGGGCNLSATVGELTLWTTRHRSGRVFVEECDFVTDLGHRTALGTRAEMGMTGGGPRALVSELGVFDFPEGRMRLREVFADVDVDDVLQATGFELEVAGDVRTVALPSDEELAILRSVDRLAVRRTEFAPRELERRFRRTGHQASCACCT
ncbi:MAG TPA: CoA-transferase [Solirubrobacteraceae bacterium]|nr:CoA-transferase [Solirubrobacteraceae bacterium]